MINQLLTTYWGTVLILAVCVLPAALLYAWGLCKIYRQQDDVLRQLSDIRSITVVSTQNVTDIFTKIDWLESKLVKLATATTDQLATIRQPAELPRIYTLQVMVKGVGGWKLVQVLTAHQVNWASLSSPSRLLNPVACEVIPAALYLDYTMRMLTGEYPLYNELGLQYLRAANLPIELPKEEAAEPKEVVNDQTEIG